MGINNQYSMLLWMFDSVILALKNGSAIFSWYNK